MACWRWGSPFSSSRFRRTLLLQFTELEKLFAATFFSETVKQASPKLPWDERCCDETAVGGKALSFLVYQQPKRAEFDKEQPLAYSTKSPSAGK